MSAFLDNFHFLRPWSLVLVLPGILLWWKARQSVDTTRRWARVMDPELLQALTIGGNSRGRLRPHDVLLIGWIVLAVVVGGPTWQRQPSPLDQAAPVMVVLEVTPSMTAPDLAPSRLDRARQKIADLLAARDGMPAGLIAYSGSAHLVLPPTADRDVVTSMAGALSPTIMPREGDRLADAVGLAAKVLADGGQGGSILVMAGSVAPGQTAALQALSVPPVIFWAMAPASIVARDANLSAAISTLHARLVQTTIDNADVQTTARRLASASAASAAGEAARWQEAGYWLTPLIALGALLWFRRGWVLSE